MRIRSYADGDRAATAGKRDRAKNVRRSAAGGQPYDHIAPRNIRTTQIARTVRDRIFRILHCTTKSGHAPGHDCLHHAGRRAKRRRTFDGIKNGQPAARSRARVKKPSAASECFDDGVNGAGDFRKLAVHRGSNQGILTIQDAQDVER